MIPNQLLFAIHHAAIHLTAIHHAAKCPNDMARSAITGATSLLRMN